MIDEKEREEIRIEAKKILENFSKALENVEVLDDKEVNEEFDGFRDEGKGEEGDKEFRKVMFENAPKTEKDCLIAEKKKW